MSAPIRIAGICGSLRKDSYNKLLLKAAKALCPSEATIEIVEIGDLPLFNQDLENDLPAAVRKFKDHVAQCDAVLFVSPEYNFSIAAPLKNAIDWGSRPYGTSCWNGKAASVIGANTGTYPGSSGTARAQYHLRQVFVMLNIDPVQQPELLMTAAPERFNKEGELIDPFYKTTLVANLNALVKKVKMAQAFAASSSSA